MSMLEKVDASVHEPRIKPGQRVKVVQQIAHRARVWTTEIQGLVLKCERAKTGSWFAHAKDDKLWLDRLVLQLDDGEIAVVHLDPYTHVQVLSDPASVAAPNR